MEGIEMKFKDVIIQETGTSINQVLYRYSQSSNYLEDHVRILTNEINYLKYAVRTLVKELDNIEERKVKEFEQQLKTLVEHE